jgi:cardiolipin synthase A/B
MHYLLELLDRVQPVSLSRLLFGLTYVLALSTMPSVLLRRRGNPRAALSWLLALFALPLLGVFLWWAFGRTRIERHVRRRSLSAREFALRRGLPHSEPDTPFVGMIPPRAIGDSVFPTNGNLVVPCIDGVRAFPAMMEAIGRARRQVHCVFYIWQDDSVGRRMRDLLAKKAREGVTVRVLVDAWGTPRFTKAFSRPLREAGVHIAAFLPSRIYPLQAPRLNFANHRKIVVVDDSIAFTGGMNIGDEYERTWRDLMIQIEGPAVHALQHVFLDDWHFATRENVYHREHAHPRRMGNVACAVIASGPERGEWLHDAHFIAFTRATRRIWIATPYFIPTQALATALRTAADRGLDVRILLPSVSDVPLVAWASRSFYPGLLESGVRIFEYLGGMMHAKAFVVDDDLTCVGSANVDNRSFRLNFEIGCLLHDQETTGVLSAWFQELVESSHEVTLPELEKGSTVQKLLESAAHLLSPLL